MDLDAPRDLQVREVRVELDVDPPMEFRTDNDSSPADIYVLVKKPRGKKKGSVQQTPETQAERDVSPTEEAEGNHHLHDTREVAVPLTSLVKSVAEMWRRRQAWHRAEKSLTLQIKGFCRRLVGGDKIKADVLYRALMANTDHDMLSAAQFSTLPLMSARKGIESERMALEKQLRELGKQLPGVAFCETTVGLTTMTMASLIGECPGVNSRGFLDFDTPSRVWKRMGLAVINGIRQKKVSGADALLHAYSPSRRAVMWTIGASIVKSHGPYRLVYDAMKEKEQARVIAKGLTILPAADIPKDQKDSGLYISEGQIHKRAQRLMEKKLLVDLWVEFRKAAVE
jgi:hypothetical protein